MSNSQNEKDLQTQSVRLTGSHLEEIMQRYHYDEGVRAIVKNEGLLPTGLLGRLHNAYPEHSGILESADFLFNDKKNYAGLKGFREITAILSRNGIEIGHIEERELFIKIYRFMATRHVLNTINWSNFAKDSVFQLVFPQPGMVREDIKKAYFAAPTEEAKEKIIKDYIIKETNPHDGKQKINRPVFKTAEGTYELLEGSQHKYPQCQLVFDVQTQNCFAFCTYCFRHAQVRGDEDMFMQKHPEQIHAYLAQHKEVTDLLITGGDAGFIKPERFLEYVKPIVEDPQLQHVKNIRLGTRILTYAPELIISDSYTPMLQHFRYLYDNGVQVAFMAHFSTPREVLNPSTIAAIRRLKSYGVTVKSQSPIMNHISMFTDEKGDVDVDRSAQNWIDLGHIFSMLGVGFHSMYVPRPTGERHYFTQPLAKINDIFSKIYRSLPSISRPSRFITMTISAGKVSILGTVNLKGQKLFALKVNEGRNMTWMDQVYLAEFDDSEINIDKLKPYKADKHFYEDEVEEIERRLEMSIEKMKKRDLE